VTHGSLALNGLGCNAVLSVDLPAKKNILQPTDHSPCAVKIHRAFQKTRMLHGAFDDWQSHCSARVSQISAGVYEFSASRAFKEQLSVFWSTLCAPAFTSGMSPSATQAAVAFAASLSGSDTRSAAALAQTDGSPAAAILGRAAGAAVDVAAKRYIAAATKAASTLSAGRGAAWTRVALAGSSVVAEEAAAVIGSRDGVVVVVLGDQPAALRLAAAGARVEFSRCSAAASMLEGCDAVLFGAEIVCCDGRLVVGDGVAAITSVAVDAGVATIAVVQTVKFTEDVMLAETDRPGVEMLAARFVTTIATEMGDISPKDAPIVAKAHR
jgi:hypothetical protein